MASDLNTVNLIGRLTKDAELTYTNSGFAITKLSLACNRSVKKGDNWEEEASFFDVKILGRRGESLNQYLLKGSQIGINGELVQERWEKDGQQRSRVSIIANNIQLLGSKSGQGNSQGNNTRNVNNDYNPNNDPRHNSQPSENSGQFEDDIPF